MFVVLWMIDGLKYLVHFFLLDTFNVINIAILHLIIIFWSQAKIMWIELNLFFNL
jgi:hypothetical protein